MIDYMKKYIFILFALFVEEKLKYERVIVGL